MTQKLNAKIGIFAGTFDPVHNGHINFANEALQKLGLEKIYFLPEPKPRDKTGVTAFRYRVKMLELALGENLEVLILPERTFSINTTLKTLEDKLPDREFVFLFGSDIAKKIPEWPNSNQLKEVIIALRNKESEAKIISSLEASDLKVHFISNPNANISASQIRSGLDREIPVAVLDYINSYKLYE